MTNPILTPLATQHISQALLSLIVMFLLLKFYRSYGNKYFQYWAWSWLCFVIYLFSACVSILCPTDCYTSFFPDLLTYTSLIASSCHSLFLVLGSYQLVYEKSPDWKIQLAVMASIIILSLGLVMLYSGLRGEDTMTAFLRDGVKSMIAAFAFLTSSWVLYRVRKLGVGIQFIVTSFLFYGLLQTWHFYYSVEPLWNESITLLSESSFSIGIVSFLLVTVMGIGMIISALEIEQVQLKKANNELDTFLYRSSHDLRGPLTTVLSLTYAIKSTVDKDEVNTYVELIENRIHQADKVINDIITLRKGQKVGLTIKKVNIREQIERAFYFLTDPRDEKIRLSVTSQNDWLNTDKERVDTAISNIISNAVKYHDPLKEDQYIRVTMTNNLEDEMVINIEDNGKGIDNKYLERIFDMFYRANKDSKGSGLGLYMTNEAINYIGGRIAVSSTLNEGTCFTLYLKNHPLSPNGTGKGEKRIRANKKISTK